MEEKVKIPIETVMVSTYDGIVGVGKVEIKIQKGDILKCITSGKQGFSILSKEYKEPCLTILDHRYRRAYKNEALKWVR